MSGRRALATTTTNWPINYWPPFPSLALLSSEQTIQLAALLLLLSLSFSISDWPFSCHWINYNLIGANKSKLIDEQIDQRQQQPQQHRWMRTVSITIVQRAERESGGICKLNCFPGREMKWKEKAEVERYCSHSARFSSHIEREQDKERLVDHLTPSSADFQLLLLLLVMMMMIMVWPLPISPFQFVVTGLLHFVFSCFHCCCSSSFSRTQEHNGTICTVCRPLFRSILWLLLLLNPQISPLWHGAPLLIHCLFSAVIDQLLINVK